MKIRKPALEREFDQLYRDHYNYVRNVLLRVTRDPDLVDDLTQQTFLRAWRFFRRWQRRCKFTTWVVRIALNVVNEQFRRRGAVRRSAVVYSLDGAGDGEQGSVDVGRNQGTEFWAALGEALAGLRPEERTAFILHEMEGWNCLEIAEAHGLTEAAVKARVYRTRKKVRDGLWRDTVKTVVSVNRAAA